MPPLTDAAIRRAKPGAKPARMLDSAGLYLEVSPKGGKYWRQRRLAHVYPDAGPADARAALRPRTRDCTAVTPGAIVRWAQKALGPGRGGMTWSTAPSTLFLTRTAGR
jgi:hypothetical protein